MPERMPDRSSRMIDRGSQFFVGREKQIEAFKEILDAVQSNFEPPHKFTKTVIAIHGEGGMGKTYLLWQFERICQLRKIKGFYLDMQRLDEPINDLVDFMRIARRWFTTTRVQKFLSGDPFAEFDAAFVRLMKLEKQLKEDELKKQTSLSAVDLASDFGAKAVVGLGKDMPFGQTVVGILGEERIEEGVEWALKGTIGLGYDRLLKALHKVEDVEFFLSHEEQLIGKFVKGIANYVEQKPLVLLIDTYEEVMSIDIPLRERLLGKLPANVVIVFAGRNSIYDNCSPGWREETQFFELREFDSQETEQCLTRRKVENEELKNVIYQFTLGVPLAVVTAANIVERVKDEEGAKDENKALQIFKEDQASWETHSKNKFAIISEVTRRFLSLVSKTERHVVEACAIFGDFDAEKLAHLLDKQIDDEYLEQLEQFSFIRRVGNSYLMHNTVRNYLLQDMKSKDVNSYQQLHSMAANYFDIKIKDLQITDRGYDIDKWRECTLLAAYHWFRSDKNQEHAQFYTMWADAYWEAEYQFCLDLLKQPDRFYRQSFNISQYLKRFFKLSLINGLKMRRIIYSRSQLKILRTFLYNKLYFIC